MSASFHDARQLGRACRALLGTLGLQRYWSGAPDWRPTVEALELRRGGAALSHGERVLVMATLDLWSEEGDGLRLRELAYELDAERTAAVCSLLRAASEEDPRAIDVWIAALEEKYAQIDEGAVPVRRRDGVGSN
jgi:hypothetical protein